MKPEELTIGKIVLFQSSICKVTRAPDPVAGYPQGHVELEKLFSSKGQPIKKKRKYLTSPWRCWDYQSEIRHLDTQILQLNERLLLLKATLTSLGITL